eukprot:252689-Amphidinium_carterae.1
MEDAWSIPRPGHLTWRKLDSVGRLEANLVSRFAQSEQLAFNRGHNEAAGRETILRKELNQARRQHGVPDHLCKSISENRNLKRSSPGWWSRH